MRDYLYVDDAVDGILTAATSRAAGTFNLAGGIGCSIRELLDLMLEVPGVPETPVFEKAESPPTTIVLDIGRVWSELGFAPRVPLREELTRTWKASEPGHAA